MTRQVAVLFARADSVYKTLPGCDVWDIDRDALRWPGGAPIVAHPPCRAWSRMQQFAKPLPGERELAVWAVEQVQRWGGVLEHPQGSQLWRHCGLPLPGVRGPNGGWTLGVTQHWWGHRATKQTLLYVVGCEPSQIPALPDLVLGEGTHVVKRDTRNPGVHRLKHYVTKPEREHTPIAFAKWLVDLARRVDVREVEPCATM